MSEELIPGRSHVVSGAPPLPPGYKPPKPELEPVLDHPAHQCDLNSPFDGHGPAVDSCDEYNDGTFWVGNGEYGSQVNFCPVCGAEAPVKIGAE